MEVNEKGGDDKWERNKWMNIFSVSYAKKMKESEKEKDFLLFDF